MRKKTLISLISIMVILIIIFIIYRNFYFKEAKEENFKVSLVTGVGGIGDQSYYDSAWRGLKRAENDFRIRIDLIEAESEDAYRGNFSNLAKNNYNLIIAMGFKMKDKLKAVSKEYPEQNFLLIDGKLDLKNVGSITFREEEGSFLAGIIAARKTENKKIAFIGGMKSDFIEKFESGFIAGANEINNNLKIFSKYTNSFNNPEKGKEIALNLYNDGVDVIYHASGACGIGIIEAAKKKNFYVIGVDSPQYHLAPENVLTSVIKRVDNEVYNIVKEAYNDDFIGKHKLLGLKSNGVSIYREQAEKMLNEELLKEVDRYREKIINKEIIVPKNLDDL
ncbi:MAG: BMP family lipoprotein [Bacillota bacterium]